MVFVILASIICYLTVWPPDETGRPRSGGRPVVGSGLAERRCRRRGRQGRWPDERAAVRAGFDGHVQGAAGDGLVPRQEPLSPAVIPFPGARAAGDRHRVARDLHVVVG